MASGRGVRPAGYSDHESDSDNELGYYCGGGSSSSKTKGEGVQEEDQYKDRELSPKKGTEQPHSSTGNTQKTLVNDRGQFGHSQHSPPPLPRGRGRGRGRWLAQCGEVNLHDQSNQSPSVVNCPAVTSQGHSGTKQELALAKICGAGDDVYIDKMYAIDTLIHLRCVWETKVQPFHLAVKQILEKCLKDEKDTRSLVLYCAIGFSDSKSLYMGPQAVIMLEELFKNLKNVPNFSTIPPHALQDVAAEFLLGQTKASIAKIVIQIFHLDKFSEKGKLVRQIQLMSSGKHFRDACQWATYLKLQEHFDVHTFCIPLLLQDKFNLVEDYITDYPELQQSIIKYFDGFFPNGEHRNVQTELLAYVRENQIKEVNPDRLRYKPVSKLIKKLSTVFNISSKYFPNIGHRQKFGELRYLFSRRYTTEAKEKMSTESFEELINELAEGNSKMQEEVLSHFMMYADFESAAKFICTHQLYTSSACSDGHVFQHLPEDIKKELEKSVKSEPLAEENWDEDEVVDDKLSGDNKPPHPIQNCSTKVEPFSNLAQNDWDHCNRGSTFDHYHSSEDQKVASEMPYYRCHIAVKEVIIINDRIKLQGLCSWMDENSVNVSSMDEMLSGFDCEWKPIQNRKHNVALIQLAFEKMIFIVDVTSLKHIQEVDDEAASQWKWLRKSYFENENILKFGYDVKNDIKMLADTISDWSDVSETLKSVVDLSRIKMLIHKEDPLFFGDSEPGLSLNHLVKQCLHKVLSKAEQMSDWEKRPLRESQIQYAADDAYCLIDVFKAIKEKSKGCPQVDLDKIVRACLKGVHIKDNSSSRKRSYLDTMLELMSAEIKEEGEGSIAASSTTNPMKVKLVVDNMLQGLGRYLRAIGFNTVVLDNGSTHKQCCELAAVGRKVITRGSAYYEITSKTSEGDVYNVKSDKIMDQIQEVCAYFNVKLQPSKLFVICQGCNLSTYIKVSSTKIKNLLEALRLSKRMKTYELNLNVFKTRAPDSMILCVGDTEKDWQILPEEKLATLEDGTTVTTEKGIPVQLNKLQSFAKLIDWVYICNECGKCYFESKEMETMIKEAVQELEMKNE